MFEQVEAGENHRKKGGDMKGEAKTHLESHNIRGRGSWNGWEGETKTDLKATVFEQVEAGESHGKDGRDMKEEAKNHLEAKKGRRGKGSWNGWKGETKIHLKATWAGIRGESPEKDGGHGRRGKESPGWGGEGHGKDTGNEEGEIKTNLKATVFEQVEAGESHGKYGGDEEGGEEESVHLEPF